MALGAGTGCGEPLAAGWGVLRIASLKTAQCVRGLGDVRAGLCKRRGLGSRQPTGTNRKLPPGPQTPPSQALTLRLLNRSPDLRRSPPAQDQARSAPAWRDAVLPRSLLMRRAARSTACWEM